MLNPSSHKLITISGGLCFLIFTLVACIREPRKEVIGYKPEYISKADAYKIKSGGPQPFQNPGKIYQYLDYSFQLDNGRGIHIIQSTNFSQPEKVAFIYVPGCSEISIRNNMLYTDNFDDLVAIDISDFQSIVEKSRQQHVFPMANQHSPSIRSAYFECPDPSLGLVFAWKEQLLINPKCQVQW